jgi:hypothetical protein
MSINCTEGESVAPGLKRRSRRKNKKLGEKEWGCMAMRRYKE